MVRIFPARIAMLSAADAAVKMPSKNRSEKINPPFQQEFRPDSIGIEFRVFALISVFSVTPISRGCPAAERSEVSFLSGAVISVNKIFRLSIENVIGLSTVHTLRLVGVSHIESPFYADIEL
jgi:hypothetical protein